MGYDFLSENDIALRLSELHEFECNLYGPDFACSLDELRPWLSSRYFFYIVFGDTSSSRVDVASSAAAILTYASDYAELRQGVRRESDLRPWTSNDRQNAPVLYFSSFFSCVSGAGRLVMERLRHDIYHIAPAIEFPVFAIGATPAGSAYLRRSGFSENPERYLSRYPIFEQSSRLFLAMRRRPVSQAVVLLDATNGTNDMLTGDTSRTST